MRGRDPENRQKVVPFDEQFFSDFTIFGRKHPTQQRTRYEILLLIASWTGILIFLASLLLYLFE